MKTLCCIAAAAALSISAPAMAQQSSLWSSAQGTAYSYGNANGFANSSSGSMAASGNGTGLTAGTNALTGASNTMALTTSTANTSSSGGGYAQVQTSGYAGGSVFGFAARTH